MHALAARADKDGLFLMLDNGRRVTVPWDCSARLAAASDAERERFVLSGGGRGLHWPELDEDLLVEAIARGV